MSTVSGQFRAARKAAEDLGAQIVLGDRPIEITVKLVLRSEPLCGSGAC